MKIWIESKGKVTHTSFERLSRAKLVLLCTPSRNPKVNKNTDCQETHLKPISSSYSCRGSLKFFILLKKERETHKAQPNEFLFESFHAFNTCKVVNR
jgi:hypothetical protein